MKSIKNHLFLLDPWKTVGTLFQVFIVIAAATLLVVAFLGWRIERAAECESKIKISSIALQFCAKRGGLAHDCDLAVGEILQAARLNCDGFLLGKK